MTVKGRLDRVYVPVFGRSLRDPYTIERDGTGAALVQQLHREIMQCYDANLSPSRILVTPQEAEQLLLEVWSRDEAQQGHFDIVFHGLPVTVVPVTGEVTLPLQQHVTCSNEDTLLKFSGNPWRG